MKDKVTIEESDLKPPYCDLNDILIKLDNSISIKTEQ